MVGESFKAIPKEHGINPTYYNKIISNVDAYLWKKSMKEKLEFMYFNQV